MATVAITELKAHLAKYLRMAQRGVEVQVLDRGVPIARLVGMPEAPQSEEAALERLVKAGIVRRGEGRVRSLLRKRLDIAPRLLEALDEDREDRA
jgi:prevent-host-death family protein